MSHHNYILYQLAFAKFLLHKIPEPDNSHTVTSQPCDWQDANKCLYHTRLH